MALYFVNDIQNPYNPKFVVYQLACLYTQRSVLEFKRNIEKRVTYEGDHHRKRVYDANQLRWIDTTKDVDLLDEGTIVRYEGFRDKSMIHVIQTSGGKKIINDVSLAVFSTLDKDVLLKESNESKSGYFNLCVPFFLGLPFWIERGLIMLNAELPELMKYNNLSYRLYKNVNEKILDVLEQKLDQKIIEI